MQDVILSLFALGIGVVFCFYGYKAMRFLFPLWGFVAGFWFGARMTTLLTGDGFFGTTLGIVVGVICALIAAVLAYLYYAVAVVIFMGIAGYWLGVGLMRTIGFNGNVVPIVTGLVLGALLILVGIFANAPKYFLLLLTSFAGAAFMVASVLLLARIIDQQTLKDGVVLAVANQSWVWEVIWVGLGIVGLLTQVTQTQDQELEWASEWEAK